MKYSQHSYLLLIAVAAMVAVTASGQVGGGTWSSYSLSKSLQQEGNVYYNNSSGVETFRLNDVDAKRCEIQLTTRWSSGVRQFEGTVRCTGTPRDAGNSVQQVMQDGSPDTDVNQLRYYASSGGELKVLQGQTLGTGIYGVWERINTIDDTDHNTAYTYLNGSLKSTVSLPGGSTFYFKYGIYIAGATGQPQSEWKGIKNWVQSSSGNGFSGWYQIIDHNSGKNANVKSAATTNGAPVILYTTGTSANEEWQLTPTDSGYYQIVNRNSGKVMAVQSASTSDGALVIQWSFGSAQNDQWKPISLGNGYYNLQNRHSGLMLDVKGANTANDTPFEQYHSTGGNNQQFQLNSVP